MATQTEYLISNEPWYQKNIWKWISYDLGNTIFSMAVVSMTLGPAVMVMYYNLGYTGEDAYNAGNLAVTNTILIGNIIMALISPILGAYSDQMERRRGLLIKLSILCIMLMASLGIIGIVENIFLFLAIFLFANLAYQMGLVVYDATLPFITDKDKIGKVGGLGVAIGYFGSFIAIGLGFLFTLGFAMDDWYTQVAEYNDAGDLITAEKFQMGYIPVLYPIAAALFFLFTIPLFTLKEKPVNTDAESIEDVVAKVKEEVITTAKEVWKFSDMKWFLLGWLIFVDVANTVILFMTPIVAVGLGFGEGSDVTVVLGIGVGSAVLFTYFVGQFVDNYGPKKGLDLITLLWLIALIIAFFTNLTIGGITTPKYLLYIFPIIVGPALGGCWVVQRSYVSELAPPSKVGNYFGFSNIFGRISAAIGPFVWTGSIWFMSKVLFIHVSMATRFGVLILGGIMIIGYIIMKVKVVDPHQAYLAGGKSQGDGTWVNDKGEVLLSSKQRS
ncbi:MAG: MFS transporter [Candidatus Heimdallarchaeota archaeon]|nr:MFS transporter [Candidatus Heimdallarchaeota archaeon]